MIPTKIEPISITMKSDKGMEPIVDWFLQHIHTFYSLGWSYLRNQEQMEELFFRSIIKVHKELPRFKNETSFEMRVTSIFIDTCRELTNDKSLQVSEESKSRHDLFKALDELKEFEKEALVFTYIKGISKEETADLLQVSVEELKEHLFFGIQSLKNGKGYGASFNGCKEYNKHYIDYLEGTMDRSKKVDFETHIFHCQDCQEELASFQDDMLTLVNFTEKMEDFHVPSDFMENVKARLAEMEKHRQRKIKKRKRIGIVLASVIALLMVIEAFTGTFTNLYYTWTEEDQQLRAFLQHGLGERLNLEAENNGVKIRIKSAIADDVQTLVCYEIEGTAKDNQYVMDYEGVSVENEHEIMNDETFQRYYHYPLDLKSKVNNKKKNVFHGKLSLQPLIKDNGTIKLKITKLLKLSRDSSNTNSYENMEYENGEWNFEIPVTKHPSIEYALNKETKVEGIPVRFDKLTIAPTTTILEFSINNEISGKRIEFLNVDNLEMNNKKVKADIYGSSFTEDYMNWNTFQARLDPLFGEKSKEVNVQFKSVFIAVKDPKTIKLDASRGYPQTFEYAGSTISIDKVEVGKPTNVVISNHEIKNRAYGSLEFDIVGAHEKEINSMGMESEGVIVDKNGVEYDMNDIPAAYEEIKQPRYFTTVQNITLQNEDSEESVIPKELRIQGYNTTKYLDDVVKLSLK